MQIWRTEESSCKSVYDTNYSIGIVSVLKLTFHVSNQTFGIVQGITEWLPVSSTGHMILINEFMKLNVSQEFWQMFLVVIQLGSILAVVVLFWNKIFPFRFKVKFSADNSPST